MSPRPLQHYLGNVLELSRPRVKLGDAAKFLEGGMQKGSKDMTSKVKEWLVWRGGIEVRVFISSSQNCIFRRSKVGEVIIV